MPYARGVIVLRLVAVVFATVAVLGECARSWGVGRPVAFWMDDVLMGALLLTGALVTSRDTPARRAFFTGAWGVAVGMAYLSFFEKLYAPEMQNPGNLPLSLLTALAGTGLVVAAGAFMASVALPFGSSTSTPPPHAGPRKGP